MTNLQVAERNHQRDDPQKRSLPVCGIFERIKGFSALGNAPLTWETTLGGRRLRAQTRYSWWDCLLLASALELDCTHFLSEGMQDGRIVDGLTIVSPFAHSPDEILPA